MTSETRFRPVTGTDSQIQSTKRTPGWVYFASDSGKIYFDADEERIVMGGSGATIFYAKDSNVIDTGFDGIYQIHVDKLDESTSSPKENDIIINTEDNCFYRVNNINDELIEALRIAVAGTGGSGTGGGGDTPQSGICSVTSPNGLMKTARYGDECILEFDVVAQNASGVETEGGFVTFVRGDKNSGYILVADIPVVNGRNSFDIGPYLQKMDGQQQITAKFKLDDGSDTYAGRSLSWKVTAIDISLEWNYNPSTINTSNLFNLNWNVIGGSGYEKVTHILIDEKMEVTDTTSGTGSRSMELNRLTYGLNHGVHTIELYITFSVGTKTFKTNSIKKQLIFVDADIENAPPVIAVGDFDNTMDQYDTKVIPIYIYNSSSALLMANGQDVDSWDDIEVSPTSATLRYWSYTPTEAGIHKLSITCGSVKCDIDIIVNELKLSVSETTGYAFKIKASDFTSNNALKNWSYKTPEWTASKPDEEVVTMQFSDNFDWINGGLKQELDESGNLRQYICVKAGTEMTIDYELFKAANRYGKNIKVIFKVENCGKYDAEIIKSYSDTGTSQRGLLMTAQSAIFKSLNNTVESQYCEENYTEYEIDITPYKQNENDLQYIMPWLAGVPAGIQIFDDQDNFQQIDGARTKITIGSEDCDVCLYLFKVYEKHLTDRQHLENFIMDALNAKEILTRYNRNDVLSSSGNGEIDWMKVIEKNPNCWIHLYKIPRMTKNKKDYIGDKYLSEINEGKESTQETAKYYALYKDGNNQQPFIQAGTEVGCPFRYKVQGTSSEHYVISAANIDCDFKKGFIDNEGNKVKTFALDDTVPGESYYNTKVNVASCEGANNALNAAWYNDYQPYVSAAKAQNPKKRDTMLFKPGIVFIQDENPLYEIQDENSQSNLDLNIFKGSQAYKSSPFYKQYAICNFGNSKKNKATLHDVNNPSEITIEVTDNQNIGQHMCRVTGRTEGMVDVLDESGNPVLNEDGTVKQKEGLIESDITRQEISYQIEKDEEGKDVVVGNDTYNKFCKTMDDKDFDVRYSNGSDGIDSVAPQQVVGFFNLVKWFALNDPNEKSEAHPYGYTNEPFTIDTPNAVYDSEKKEYVVHFNPYTFKSEISFETGNGYVHKYSPKLGGLTVSTYAGDYTRDNHNYRMAKLLSECENHLIMDSIIYHYLFIEKHLMVDNVAKNTFWSSEDKNNQYWQLIKDYDNDTADGIDNDGKLSFTYGIEPQDYKPNGISYFNAPNSVWFNFVHGLESVRTSMYQSLSDAWNVNNYLNKFEQWQSAIPEICWIEDYYRKYIRPYEIFNDSSYLARLEGGKKTYQRKQFENYQNIYMDSKYAQTKNTTSIYIRANEPNPSSINLPVTMYSDCYVYQSWSQNIIKERVKRGETYYVKCPPGISRLDDATVYWYFANTYSTIGNFGALKPKGIALRESKRLQVLEAYAPDGGKLPEFDTPTDLSIGQATLLKHIKLNGFSCKTGTFPLDLSQLASLQDFDGKNSSFTSITFPSGAPITSIKTEAPRVLSAKNLNYLNEFTLENYNNLSAIYFDDIDKANNFNSLNMVINANNLEQYCLLNVEWNLDRYTDSQHFDETNISIDFLDKLISKQAMDIKGQNNLSNKADGLSGKLNIGKNAYSGDKALELYEKYSAVYPNLDINFEAENCKLLEVNVIDGNNKKVWQRKFKDSIVLTEDFYAKGQPENLVEQILDIITSKQDSADKTYTFANKWKITSGGKETVISVTAAAGQPQSILPITSTALTDNITIEPVFNENIRQYTLTFANEDGTEIFGTQKVNYGTKMSNITMTVYPYKDDSDLEPENNNNPELAKTYKLKGWSLFKNGEILQTYNDLTVQADYNFYAVFEPVLVKDNVLSEDYLESTTINGKTVSFPSSVLGTVITSYKYVTIPGTGHSVRIKSGIHLRGKITLPISYKGQPIFGYKQGGIMTDVTNIYWERETSQKPMKVYSIEADAFSEWSNLSYFEVPSSLVYLSQAFRECPKLQMPKLTDANNLVYIGTSTFQGSLGPASEIVLPGSLRKVGQNAFYRLEGHGNSIILQIGTPDKRAILNAQDFGAEVFGSPKKAWDRPISKIIIYAEESSDLNTLDSYYGLNSIFGDRVLEGTEFSYQIV